MFSGIVTGQGTIIKIRPSEQSLRLIIRHSGLGRKIAIGESIAVDGCCLTVVASSPTKLEFDVLQETWTRTCFSRLHMLDKVNLEPSMRFNDLLGGHLVTGHIDCMGRITKRKKLRSDVLIEIEPPADFMKWIAMKGSVAMDGVSLTVAEVGKKRFAVWVIPHTLKITTLGWKKEGDKINLEGDIISKYIERHLERK